MAIKGRYVAGLGGGALALAAFLITAFESPNGLPVLHVYPDPVTHARPWTYCDGETQKPRAGHTYTVAECDAETAALVKQIDTEVRRCLGGTPPDNARAAFDSLAWNIGAAAFCRSSIPDRFKAGDLKGACNVIALYNHAGGKVIPGLTYRRGEEQRYCLKDAA